MQTGAAMQNILCLLWMHHYIAACLFPAAAKPYSVERLRRPAPRPYPFHAAGHTVVEMRALEARQMAPPGTAATTAAVAALAAAYGDVEEGRSGAVGAAAAPVKSRRGFSRWASGVSDGLCAALGRRWEGMEGQNPFEPAPVDWGTCSIVVLIHTSARQALLTAGPCVSAAPTHVAPEYVRQLGSTHVRDFLDSWCCNMQRLCY